MSLAEIAKKGVGVPKPTVFSFKDTDQKAQSIILDCSVSINTNVSSKVTLNPVEEGFDVTDHIVKNPLKLKISGVISESPPTPLLNVSSALTGRFVTSKIPPTLGISSGFLNAAASAGIRLNVGGIYDAFTSGGQQEGTIMGILGERKQIDFDYPKRMMRALIEMCNLGIVISAQTNFNDKNYVNMVIQNASFSQTAAFSDSLKFELDCVQIRVVKSKKYNKLKPKTESTVADDASSSAADEANNGSVTKKEPATSVVKRISDWAAKKFFGG